MQLSCKISELRRRGIDDCGTNIGAGVLSIAYASSKAGFLPLLFWLVVLQLGSLTTVTMLYVAESRCAPVNICSSVDYRALRRRLWRADDVSLRLRPAYRALTAYMTGSGKLLHSLFISPALGSVLFRSGGRVLYGAEGDRPR